MRAFFSTKDVADGSSTGQIKEDLVGSTCDEIGGGRCLMFPGISQRLHWNLTDPSSFTGSYEEKLYRIRDVRDAIKAHVEQFARESLTYSEQ